MTTEAARDRQVAIETVRYRADCHHCNPGCDSTEDEAAAVLRASLAAVEDQLATLDRDTTRLKEVEDFDLLLDLHHQAVALAGKVRDIVAVMQDAAWKRRGDSYGDYHHPSLGVVSVRRTATRARWDHASTASRVVDKQMERRGYEIPNDPAEVARWILEAGAVTYWRKGVLTDLGIDVDGEELLTKERGNPVISFPSTK